MAFSYTDIAKLAGAVAATIVLTLLWIHRSSQQRVDRSLAHSVKVALRLLLVHAVSIYVLCIAWRMPVNWYLGLTAIVYVCGGGVTWSSGGADDILGFAFGMVLIVPVYVLKQFVLGFPDMDDWVLQPPRIPVRSDSVLGSDPPPRKSDDGTVVAALRPMGKVELAGEQFNAVSADGKLIPVGTPIRVCGSRGDVFLVAVSTTENAAAS